MSKNKDFLSNFNDKDKKKLKDFFIVLENKIKIKRKDRERIIKDFEDYILLFSKKKSISDILKLLDLTNFENAYTKSNAWYPLDNSSKIYPVSMHENWMSIYRLSYYLNEPVIKEVLQLALTFTIIRFPIFRTSIHKGFFWNYLDGISKHFDVREEDKIPCSKINIDHFNTHNRSCS